MEGGFIYFQEQAVSSLFYVTNQENETLEKGNFDCPKLKHGCSLLMQRKYVAADFRDEFFAQLDGLLRALLIDLYRLQYLHYHLTALVSAVHFIKLLVKLD